jgi:hypothetical protein
MTTTTTKGKPTAASREVPLSPETAKKLENLAWVQETTKSELMEKALRRFIRDGYKGLEPLEPDTETVRVRFTADDVLWQKADTRAWNLFSTRSEALRTIINDMVKNVPSDRKELLRG